MLIYVYIYTLVIHSYGECIVYGVDQCENDCIGEMIEIYLTFWMIDIFETDMCK